MCALFLVQHVQGQKSNNIMLIFPVVCSITIFVTVPTAPFVNPPATSIFIVIITLALNLTAKKIADYLFHMVW